LYGKTIKNTLSGSVSISGDVIYGNTLTANPNITADPNTQNAGASADSYTYQWYSNSTNSTSGGTAISGATSKTYTIGTGLIDKYIYVVVTAKKNNYVDKVVSVVTSNSVSERAVTVTASAQTVTYGTAITQGTSKITTSNLVSGDSTTSVTLTQSRTTAGTGTVSASAATIKKGSTDVTDNYNITYKTGTLTVNKKPATVTAASDSKTYNGSALTNSGCTANNNGLLSGHTVSCTMTSGSTITNAGSVNNTINTYVIRDASWNDVTSNYDVTKTAGTLTVGKASCSCEISSYPTTLEYAKNTSGTISYSCGGDGTINVTSGTTNVITVGSKGTTSTPLTAVGVGSSIITVSRGAGTNYNACTSDTQSVSVTGSSYTITASSYSGSIPSTSGWSVASGSATATKSVSYDSTYGTLPTPVKTGYTFNGWYSNLAKAISFTENSAISGSNGAFLPSYSGYAATANLIPIKGGITLYSNLSICGIYTYDSSGNFIERVSSYTTTHPISSTAAYIRIELNVGNDISYSTYMSDLIISNTTAAFSSNTQITSSTSNTVTSDHMLYAKMTPNALTFGNQTFSVTYSASSQTKTITGASNGTGSYAYSISGTGSSYFSISGTTLTIAAKTPAGTYSLTVTAKDNNSGSSKSATFTVTVGKISLTPSVTASNKTYNGNTTATCTVSLSGVLSGDTVTGSTGSCTFADKNVGTGKTVTGSSITLSGTSAGNYTLSKTSVTTTANITAKSLTPSISSVSSKTYNGNTTASCTVSLSGIVSGDTVTASAGSCTFSDKNVGTGKTVTASSITISGTDAGNYTLSKTTATLNSGSITAKSLTPSISASNKTYNGNSTASCTVSLSGIVSGDTVTASAGSCTFSDKNVGTGKTVTASSITISGTSSGNYTLSKTSATTTANITAKSLTPSVSASNKTYNGNTTATCTVSLSQIVSGDTVTASAGSCTFADANVGTGKTVTASNITLSGTSAGNYTLSKTSATTTANITALAVTVTARAQTITTGTNGTASISTGTSYATLAKQVSGHTLSAVTLTASRTTYGTGTITPSAATIKSGSTDVTSNYSITYNTGTLTVNDGTAPSISVSFKNASNTTYSGGWTTGNVTASITFSDGGSGISASTLAWNKCASTDTWSNYSNTSTSSYTDTWSSERNSTTCKYRICDTAGNCNTTSAFTIRIDKTAPTLTLTNSSNENWTNDVVTVKIDYSDNLSIVPSTLAWAANNDTYYAYTNNTNTSTKTDSWGTNNTYLGETTAKYKICDSAGNCTYKSTMIRRGIYTVSYNMCSGSGGPSAQTKYYGTTLKLSTTTPTRSNYNFKGWATDSCSGSAVYAAGANYTTNAAVTLYAVWQLAYTDEYKEVQTYTVEYNDPTEFSSYYYTASQHINLRYTFGQSYNGYRDKYKVYIKSMEASFDDGYSENVWFGSGTQYIADVTEFGVFIGDGNGNEFHVQPMSTLSATHAVGWLQSTWTILTPDTSLSQYGVTAYPWTSGEITGSEGSSIPIRLKIMAVAESGNWYSGFIETYNVTLKKS